MRLSRREYFSCGQPPPPTAECFQCNQIDGFKTGKTGSAAAATAAASKVCKKLLVAENAMVAKTQMAKLTVWPEDFMCFTAR